MSASAKPYLLRALWEWCTDEGNTPYMHVQVDEYCDVPSAFVGEDGTIVLNISSRATKGLQMGNEFIRFQSRFGGRIFDVSVPCSAVIGLIARETGQGLTFTYAPYTPLSPYDTPTEPMGGNTAGAGSAAGAKSGATAGDRPKVDPKDSPFKLIK